jgi:ATP adenylyltransferase
MEYILSDRESTECIFCPGGDRPLDESRLILSVGELSVVMMNRYPYNNGHLLVAPVRHASGLDELSEDESLDLMLNVRRSVEVLRNTMNPDGFNVGLNLGKTAGAGIEEHIHFHVLPRWNGDTNYMTVLGEIRVIPEHIKETYDKLLPHFHGSKKDSGGSE